MQGVDSFLIYIQINGSIKIIKVEISDRIMATKIKNIIIFLSKEKKKYLKINKFLFCLDSSTYIIFPMGGKLN
jgi:hypothetical protein